MGVIHSVADREALHQFARSRLLSAASNFDTLYLVSDRERLSAAEIDEIYPAGAAGFAARDCTNPDGIEGALIYNLDANRLQYCDGAQWVRLGGP